MRPGLQPPCSSAGRHAIVSACISPSTVSLMHLNLRYFASLREALGPGEALHFDADDRPATVGALRDRLIERGGRHAELLARGRAVRCAVDQVVAEDHTPLPERAEVAFFPPVTGG